MLLQSTASSAIRGTCGSSAAAEVDSHLSNLPSLTLAHDWKVYLPPRQWPDVVVNFCVVQCPDW